MIKQLLFVFILIQFSSYASAYCIYTENHGTICTHEPRIPLPAVEARERIENIIYNRHIEAIDWWVGQINGKIEKESRNENASLEIEITAANMEVQVYLQTIYEQAGYNSEVIPGWDVRQNMPNGRTYFELSW